MSSKDGSVAPKERLNIKYVPATGDQQAETELPLKMFVVGDFKGQPEETPIEERKAISVAAFGALAARFPHSGPCKN